MIQKQKLLNLPLVSLLVVTLGRFFWAEWVRASTGSRRVFAEYFKPMHTDKFASSQESRNQKIFYFVLSQINIHHNSRLSFKNIPRQTEPPFVEQPPHPGGNPLCLGAGCRDAKVLAGKPHQGGILLHSHSPPSQGITVVAQGRLISVPAVEESSLMTMKRMIITS